jgi:hypothetical protein
MAGKAETSVKTRGYHRPALSKRQELGRVTEGPPAVVTDGGSKKGGCFPRDSR